MAERVPVWRGTVTADGRLELYGLEASDRRAYLRTLAGLDVDVIVSKRRRQRSLDQNNWVWGVALPVLADGLGYDTHEHELLHYSLLAECFGTTYDPRMGREWPSKTSSQLSTKEFSDYMEWLVRWAACEHGIRIPLPGESEAA